jgi:uncharacterized membrane protein (DUF4010 family)
MPEQIESEESVRTRETPRSAWLELCVSAIYLFTMGLVFEGATAICKLVWPHEAGTAYFASFVVFLAWIFAADWLKIFTKREPVFSGRRYSQTVQFLFYFVFFSVAMMLLDKWQGQRVEILGACVAGLIYAIGMAWVVPQFRSNRKDPFATKSSFHRSEFRVVGQSNCVC